MKIRLVILVLACLFSSVSTAWTLPALLQPAPDRVNSVPQPYGLYYLLQVPNNGSDAMADVAENLDNPNVDGFRLRVTWKDIQRDNESTYNWDIIDDIKGLISTTSKKLGISVSAGITCPDWVYTSSPTVYKYTLDPSTGIVNEDVAGAPPYSLPFPWDINFQQKWQTFLNAFGLKYDNDPKVAYVVTTGYMQLVTLNFIQNTDGSATFSDGSWADNSNVFQSNSASFSLADVGRTIAGPTIKPNTTIQTIISSKKVVLSKTQTPAQSGQTFYIYGRFPGQGDDFKVNNLAKHHPNGEAGDWPDYSDVAPWPPYPTGYASNAAFLAGAKAIVDMFFTAFPHRSLLISPQLPFPPSNPYGANTNLAIRDYVTDHWPLYQGGTDYTNLQAIQGPDYPPRIEGPNPNVKQCIHSSLQTDQLYASPTPSPIPDPPQPLMDLMESGYSKGAKALEMYKEDMEAEPNTDGRYEVLTAERLKFLP